MRLKSGSRIILAALVAIVSAAALPANGEVYVRASGGSVRTKAEDFSFISPPRNVLGLNAVSADWILLNNVTNSTLKNLWSLALGYRFAEIPLRAEVRYDDRGASRFSGDADVFGTNYTKHLIVRTTAWMAYAFHDIPLDEGHELYAGVGIGRARHRAAGRQGGNVVGIDDQFPAQNQTSIATGLVLGYAYQLSTSATLELEYGYTKLGDVGTGATGPTSPGGMNSGEQLKATLKAQDIRLGLRWGF